MKTAFLQCHAGISGDMFLGALLDAGLDEQELREMLKTVGVAKDELIITKTVKKGISATSLKVNSQKKHHLHVSDIEEKLSHSSLKPAVAKRSMAIFHRILHAESLVHGVPFEKVHLHEVSALDTIVDLLGVTWGVDRLGIDRIYSTPLNVGSGSVKISHGVVPVPAPATAIILKGIPIVDDGLPGERTTPTGAALAVELVDEFRGMGGLTVETIGYGAGSLDSGDRANVLRILIGTSAALDQDAEKLKKLMLLETDIDDESPEILGYLLNQLYQHSGVLDTTLIQTLRKKNRPGYLLRVLVDAEQSEAVRNVLFRETSTLGIREVPVNRYCLPRQIEKVKTRWGSVGVVVSNQTVSPEYEDCRSIATRENIPLREVYQVVRNNYFTR